MTYIWMIINKTKLADVDAMLVAEQIGDFSFGTLAKSHI